MTRENFPHLAQGLPQLHGPRRDDLQTPASAPQRTHSQPQPLAVQRGLVSAGKRFGELPVLAIPALALSAERAAGLKRLASAGVLCLDALPAEAAAPLIAAWLEARRSGS